MSFEDEKRSSSRRSFRQQVFYYHDGQRISARSTDISIGGAYLETGHRLNQGERVALIFPVQVQRATAPVFLVGEVTRVGTGERPGVGLHWMLAATDGPRAELAEFLGSAFGIRAATIHLERHGPEKKLRAVYHFPEIDSAGAPMAGPTAGEPDPVRTSATRAVDGLPPTVPASAESILAGQMGDEPPAPRLPLREPTPHPQFPREPTPSRQFGREPSPTGVGHEEPTPGFDAPGPLTDLVHARTGGAVCDLQASVRFDGKVHEGRLLILGTKAMVVAVGATPQHRSEAIVVSFTIEQDRERMPIKANCRLIQSKDREDGLFHLELKVQILDEGPFRGVLSTYVKWLHIQTMA